MSTTLAVAIVVYKKIVIIANKIENEQNCKEVPFIIFMSSLVILP
jgi:hypothetical protein